MRLNEIDFNDSKPIDGYGPGFFRIGGDVYTGPVLTGPFGTQAWEGLEDVDALLAIRSQIDVIFIGTGATIDHLPDALREVMDAENIAVEAMASDAACRTYNVLLSEGRRVAAALLPV